MRVFGVLIFLAAVLALVFGFTVDTSIETGLGGRVHNIGLMNEKQNIIIAGGALAVVGAILMAFGGGPGSQTGGRRPCPHCAESVKLEARVCPHCKRDIPTAAELESRRVAEQRALTELHQRDAEAARLAERELPQGSCPNCDETIPLSSSSCRRCKADFGASSAWRVKPLNTA